MLKIGDFSGLSRVSIRMLRYYDEIRLLQPAYIDPDTDYRYYSAAQLPAVGRIISLRDMGFSLGEIRELLAFSDDREQLAACFASHREKLLDLQQQTEQKLKRLAAAEKRLRKDVTMTYNVTIKTIPQRYAACLRMTLPTYEDEGMVWELLCRETDPMNLIPDDPCLCSVTFWDQEYKEHDVDLEAQKTVKGRYADTEHVRFRTLPEVTVASCTFNGSYEQMDQVYAAVGAWVQENGYEMCGPMFNIYHISPYETQNPDEFVTEVCYPIQK